MKKRIAPSDFHYSSRQESIWHRMGDRAGAWKRYARVPLHAMATFFALRRVFRSFDHRGHRGLRGGSAEKKEINHENHEKARIEEAGQRLDKPSCAAFTNPLPIELDRDCANTSPIRSADGPAVAESKTGIGSAKVYQLADSKRFWEGQSQAGLRILQISTPFAVRMRPVLADTIR